MSSLRVESWTWCSLCICMVLLRLISRSLLRKSIRNLQIDDFIMCFALCTYTVLIALVNIIIKTSTNLMKPGDIENLTPQDVERRKFGSKMVLVAEEMQINTIWMIKICLLIMYFRLTRRSKFTLRVKLVAAYVGCGYVFMQIMLLAIWCRPFHEYWAVPTDNVQCNAQLNHLITNVVLNSDLMILALPIPIVLSTQLPLKKKIVLCCIFCLGTFTVISALLNKYYSFHQPYSIMWTFWYLRESSTALLVSNIPFTWTLFQRIFKLHSWAEYSNSNTEEYIRHRLCEGFPSIPAGHSPVRYSPAKYGPESSSSSESRRTRCSKWAHHNRPDLGFRCTESEEHINTPAAPASATPPDSVAAAAAAPLEIWHNVDYSVTTNSFGAAATGLREASCRVHALEKVHTAPRRQSRKFVAKRWDAELEKELA